MDILARFFVGSKLDRKLLAFLAAALFVLALGGILVYQGAVELNRELASKILEDEKAWVEADLLRLRLIILGCGTVAAGFLLLVFAVFHRELMRRRQAEAELTESMHRMELSNQEIVHLSSLVESLQACQDFVELRQITGRALPLVFPDCEGAVAILSDPAQTQLKLALSFGADRSPQSFQNGDCWALRRGQPYLSGPGEGLPCRHLAAELPGQAYCLPLLAQGQLLGLLTLTAPGILDERRQKLAVLASEHLSLALANLALREKLKVLSTRDPLTGLYNRRYLDEAFERVKRRARERPFGLVMLDIDHFKQFNDRYGHDAGDRVLKEISLLLQRLARPGDTVFRYGGEELVLLLPDVDAVQVGARAEELRQEVESLQLSHQGQPMGSLTISLGTALSPGSSVKLEALLKQADLGLYQAKSEGRNRVAAGPSAHEMRAG